MIEAFVSGDKFRSAFYEKEPLVVRNGAKRFDYDWRDFDLSLSRVEPTADRVKLLNGSRVDNRNFSEDYKSFGRLRTRFIKDALYPHLEGGATLVINSLEEACPVVSSICSEIAQYTRSGVTANAYASFGGPAATNIHWDTHDVFVVQLVGEKHWQVFEPTLELPVNSQVSNNRKSEAPTNPTLDLVLEQGDVLYIPRGWWHRVSPIQGQETIHLAVGLHPPLVMDYLVWACAHRLPEELSFRRSLIAAEGEAGILEEAASRLVEILRAPSNVEAFHRRALERQRTETPFNISSLVKSASQPLPATAKLHANVKYLAPRQEIHVNGSSVTLAGLDLEIFDSLAKTPGVSLSELSHNLPSVDPEQLDRTLKGLVKRDVVAMSLARD